MPPRILIVDPQPFLCETVACSLQVHASIGVVGYATGTREARRLAATTSPDLVLTEVDLREGSGLDLTRQLSPSIPVVVLTRRPVGEILLDAVAAGASGCLSHDLGPAELGSLIEQAIEGRFVLEIEKLHSTLRRASEVASEDGRPHGLERLTDRERQVLDLVAAGHDDPAIARQLYVSPHTIRTHVGNILTKLQVHSRAQAVKLALRPGEAGSPEILQIRGPDLERR